MKQTALFLAFLAITLHAHAHRLDECPQATRITIQTNRVELAIDITPGVAIADQFRVVIDRNQDGRILPDEAKAYARRVLKELPVQLDGQPVKLGWVDLAFPTVQEMKSGVGVIRIKAVAVFAALTPGLHRLNLTNNHLPAISVYLVNAVKPKDVAISIGKQSRDQRQKEYHLEFRVNHSVEPRDTEARGK